MGTEILNLSTTVERATVNIESKKHPKGKLYEFANLADLGPYEHAVLAQRMVEVNELRKLKKMTAAQQRQIDALLDEMVSMICLKLEPVVLAALTDAQKQWILLTWSARLETPGAAEGNRKSRRTTAASSRGSSRSTAATRKRGSTPPRG